MIKSTSGMFKTIQAFAFAFLLIFSASAQQPEKPTATEIYESIKKLNFLGSVLYIAAHPDDENTRLISHLSNEVKARTAYLSITRGDGGQNLIGSELGELLGLIRTHELAEARKIDGGEQIFTRARDFGFSKNPEETFSFWNKEEVLSDVVLAIRKFRPDIIINRFNHRTAGSTHGHHTAAAILGVEAFDLAASTNAYPEHLKKYDTWQPQRLFFNTSWWFYGSQEKFDEADKSNFVSLKTGKFYPSLGLSNGEIAALSRSQHQSQGFGATGTRGGDTEYLELLKGDFPDDTSNLFHGINTTWSRIEGGEAIGNILSGVENNFDFRNPAASLPELLKAYNLLKNRTDYWGIQKTVEIKEIIEASAGLFLEAVATSRDATRASEVDINIEAINRSEANVKLISIKYNNSPISSDTKHLENNKPVKLKGSITIPSDMEYTNPYWLREKGSLGLFEVNDISLIGLPFKEETFPVIFTLKIEGVEIPFTKNIIHKYNSPITGEVYEPFQVLPKVTGKIAEKVLIFSTDAPQQVPVTIRAGRDNISGTATLQHPKGWTVSPPQTFKLGIKGETRQLVFTVTPPKHQSEGHLKLLLQIDDSFYQDELVTIDYVHIPFQQVLLPAETKVARIDLKKNGNNIGYIAGAGDAIPEALKQMGYEVTEINPEQISAANLSSFDAVVVGIRAYNVIDALQFKQAELMKYVENGGNLIVQYNVSQGLVTKNLAPYHLKLSRDRVTEEDATVTFIDPNHEVLNTPNKITAADFENWVQERGLYFADEWAPEFTPILQMNDQGESPKQGSLLIASYGKGNYVYTGLSFFRVLPAGVPGAYRLFANLLSLSTKNDN